MFSRLIDFGDVAVRMDEIRKLVRGVDGTSIECAYGPPDDGPTTSMPYRDALKLYEEHRALSEREHQEYMLKLTAAGQRVI